MGRKITLENLPDAINDVLQDYKDSLEKELPEVTTRISNNAKIALKNLSLEKFKPDKRMKNGRYGTGWSVKITRGRLVTSATIYNAKYPSLTHLLENGHAKRGGGRVEGRPHISTIEEKVAEEFMQGVIKII